MICPHCGKAISKMISDEDKKLIMELHKDGFASRDIAAKLGNRVSFSSAARIIRELSPPVKIKHAKR